MNTYPSGRRHTSRHEKTAIRSAIRLLDITTDGWDEAEACDRHYDAGEWSGPAWADNWERERDRVTTLVAERFDIWPHDLADWIENWIHNAEERYMDSLPIAFTTITGDECRRVYNA